MKYIESSKIWENLDRSTKEVLYASYEIFMAMDQKMIPRAIYDKVYENYDMFRYKNKDIANFAYMIDATGYLMDLTNIMNFIATCVNHTANVW